MVSCILLGCLGASCACVPALASAAFTSAVTGVSDGGTDGGLVLLLLEAGLALVLLVSDACSPCGPDFSSAAFFPVTMGVSGCEGDEEAVLFAVGAEEDRVTLFMSDSRAVSQLDGGGAAGVPDNCWPLDTFSLDDSGDFCSEGGLVISSTSIFSAADVVG